MSSQLKSFAWRPNIHIKPSPKVHTDSARGVFELLNYHNQDLTHPYLVGIWKKSALEEAEETQPEHKERTMVVLKLTEGLALTEAGIMASLDIDRNK